MSCYVFTQESIAPLFCSVEMSLYDIRAIRGSKLQLTPVQCVGTALCIEPHDPVLAAVNDSIALFPHSYLFLFPSILLHPSLALLLFLPPHLPLCLSPPVGPPLLLPIYFHVEIVTYIFSGRKWVVSLHLCLYAGLPTTACMQCLLGIRTFYNSSNCCYTSFSAEHYVVVCPQVIVLLYDTVLVLCAS